MQSLYEQYLPIVQALNTYGGVFTSHHITETALTAIDAGADAGDTSLIDLRNKFLECIQNVKGLQDYKTFSRLFEIYYEAIFYLAAEKRGITLKAIPAGGKYGNAGKSADFATISHPEVRFEIKTIDVADPRKTYGDTMYEGLNAKIEAEAKARAGSGVGIVARTINPHGEVASRFEAVEQVMKKIDGNVKYDQYSASPTFLVVSCVRCSILDGPEQLKRRLAMYGCHTLASGQLFAIAAHQIGNAFYFFAEPDDVMEMNLIPDPTTEDIVDLGALNRAGILIDHPYIAGLIFLKTEWSEQDKNNAFEIAYSFNGIWNSEWERSNWQSAELVAAAKSVFIELCHYYNDINDTRSSALPEF